MEFIAYCLIYLLMIFFIFFPGIVKERFFFIFWLIIAVSLSFIIRSTIGEGGIQTDIEGYVISMQQNTVDHTYFLREFSRSRIASIRTKAIVVDCGFLLRALVIDSKLTRSGVSSLIQSDFLSGILPPSALRLSFRYLTSGLSEPGL